MTKNIILTHFGSISDFSVLNKKTNIYHFPMLNIESNKLNPIILSDYEYFIFTSKNGVDSFVKLHKNSFKAIKTICFGKKLYEKMKYLGFNISYYCENPYKQNLVEELISSNIIKNKKVIYITGNLSDNFIEMKLKNHCHISRKNIYTTTAVKTKNNDLEKILNKKKNCILIFTSPSAFDSFIKKYQIRNQKIGVIGKTTKKHINNKNYNVDFIPKSPSYNDLCEEINKYINELD